MDSQLTIETPLDEMLDDLGYNWAEAHKYAEWTMEDIEEVLASCEGENDGLEWICIVKLKDGTFGYLEAGCDYTGWGCQEGGQSFKADTFEELWRMQATQPSRERFQNE